MGRHGGERVVDILMTPAGEFLRGRAIESRPPTAPAARWPGVRHGLAQGSADRGGGAPGTMHEAILRPARAGHGPLDHAWPLRGRV